jgi:teichuronic acid biosynthesis glycosyltransferase TuaG
MTKFISILIPLYNGIEFLQESLTSIVLQSYPHWEVIIGINGHPPNSIIHQQAHTILNNFQEFSHKIKIIHYETHGKSATLNQMVNDSSFPYIAILDVDDIWTDDKLESQIPFLDDYHVVGSHCRYFGDYHTCPNIPFGNLNDFNFLSVNPIINSSAILRKEDAFWNTEELTGLEDYDLWLNLFYLKKRKFYNIPKILCLHRIHQQSAFNNNNHLYLDNLKKKWISILVDLHLQ